MSSLSHQLPGAMGNPLDDLLQQGFRQMNAGNLFQAAQMFDEATRIDPGNVDAWHMRALVAAQQRQYDQAIALFEKALSIKPNFADAYLNLGNVYREAGKFPEALGAYKKAVRHEPDNALFHCNLGSGHHQLGEYQEARKAYGKSLHLDPNNADTYCNLAVTLSVMGEKEAKVEACEKALALRPSYGQAFHLLAQDRKWSEKPSMFDTMVDYFADTSLSVDDRIHIGYGLGKIMEDLCDSDAAFDYFTHANMIKRETFTLDIHQSVKLLREIRTQFTPEWAAAHGSGGAEDAAPVFIVGMPRSGTTLVEQILSQHSEVFGSGERMFISQIILGVERDAHKKYPHFMPNLPDHAFKELGDYYMGMLRPVAKGKPRFITDKLPGNLAHVGFIKTILPNAKIICCRRDARDNAISLYKRQFGGFVPYSYDLYEAGHMIGASLSLMDYWLEVFGAEDILEVSYEDVVADVETQARRMTDFLGLSWEEACLDFHKNKRAVTTASYEQVRKPIYSSSVGTYQPYADKLTALYCALEAHGISYED